MTNYMSKYIKNLSSISEPLRLLERKDIEWHWELPQRTAFQQIKNILANAPTLRYFDINK